MRTSRPRTRAALVVVPVAAIVVFCLWPAAHADTPKTPPPAKVEPHTWQPEPAREVHTARSADVGAVHFIDAVLLDRDSACAHEPVLVTVNAHDPRETPKPLHIQIGTASVNPAPVSYSQPGEYRLFVSVYADDGARDERTLTLKVNDCGDAYQYVLIHHEGSPEPDRHRFVASPIFNREGCSERDADGGRVPQSEFRACNRRAEPGERLTYAWDFGDGTRETTREPLVEHDFSNRTQDADESTFLVKVNVESSTLGTIAGSTSLTLANLSFKNKRTAGVITPMLGISGRHQEGPMIVWDAVARNPDASTLMLDHVQVTLIPCSSGDGADGDAVTFTRAAREMLDVTDLPPGKTSLHFQVSSEEASEAFCSFSAHATGTAPGDYKVDALFGDQLKDGVGAREMDPNDPDPRERKRLDRALRALQILGRGQDGGLGTVTDDEIRLLQLQGKLD